MKGLLQVALQRYILMVILVLLIAVLVVVAIMKDRLLQVLGIINPWAEKKIMEEMCLDKCGTWCRENAGNKGTPWNNLEIKMPRGRFGCGDILNQTMGGDIGNCTCMRL